MLGQIAIGSWYSMGYKFKRWKSLKTARTFSNWGFEQWNNFHFAFYFFKMTRATLATSAERSLRTRVTWSAMLNTCAPTKQAAPGSVPTAAKHFSTLVIWEGTCVHIQVSRNYLKSALGSSASVSFINLLVSWKNEKAVTLIALYVFQVKVLTSARSVHVHSFGPPTFKDTYAITQERSPTNAKNVREPLHARRT